MFKKVLLHIGQSKTGTTSLQSFFTNNRERLAENGILYPDVAIKGVPTNLQDHNSFSQALAGLSLYPYLSCEEYIEQFKKQAGERNCDTLILSAEGFFGAPHIWTLDNPSQFLTLHSKKIQKLKTLIGSAPIHCLLYLRRQDDWFDSAVGQIVRYEGLLGQKVYENDEQLYRLLKPHLEYSQLVSLWQEILQPITFDIIAFERQKLIGKNTILDMLERTNLTHIFPENIQINLHEHESLSYEAVEYKKQLNTVPCSKSVEKARIKICNEISQELASPYKYQTNQRLKERIIKESKGGNNFLETHYNFSGFSVGSSKSNFPKEENLQESLLFFDRRYRRKRKSYKIATYILMTSIKSFTRQKLPFIHSLLKNQYKKFNIYSR